MRLQNTITRTTLTKARLIAPAVGLALLAGVSFHAEARDGGIGAGVGAGVGGIGAGVGAGGIGAGVGAGIGGGGIGAGAGVGAGGAGAGVSAGIGSGSADADASVSVGGTQGAASISIGRSSTNADVSVGTLGNTAVGVSVGITGQQADQIGSLANMDRGEIGDTFGALGSRDIAKLRKTCRAVLAAPTGYSANTLKVCRVIASL